ncbi:MAG: 2'-5' RNA ligase family protein, partial [Planctomycetota bacterium]
EHDPQVGRWMPHVTMLYPFVPERELARVAARLGPLCAAELPFSVTLRDFGHFAHGGSRATVWLRPEPAGAARGLQRRLLEGFPWCDDTGRFARGFTPHLSVGRWPVGEVSRAIAELRETWQPLRWKARRVCLIARPDDREAPFAIRHSLPLGTGTV